MSAHDSPARRRLFERFADAAFKTAQRFRTVLADTSAADDLSDAVRLLWWALPGGTTEPLSPATVAEVRARCAAIAAHAFRVAEAHAARVQPDAAPQRPAPSPLDTPQQGDAP